MGKNGKDYLIPNYVIHALIAGVLFLLVALVLGILMFAAGEEPGQAPQTETARETVEKQSLDERLIVVVDAGHGGSDPGAVAESSGVTEAEINQKMADKLTALLQRHQAELRVEAAHEPGQSATVMERANVALQLDADLLVSLHLNADEGAGGRGFQVYPTPPGRVHHAASLRLAQLMVERVREGTDLPIIGDNGVFYAYYHEVPGGYWQEQVDSVWVDEASASQSPSFGVVENAGCPAVLVEQWFISSRQDMALMNTEAGCDAMAQSLYRAICDYFELAPMD